MLRIEFQEHANTTTIKILGRFVDRFAEDARSLVVRSQAQSQLIADLSDMTFVDETGEEVLLWLKWIGAKFTAEGAYSRDVCERLSLPMAKKIAQPRRKRLKQHLFA